MAFRDRALIAPIIRFVTEEHIRTLLILFSAIVFVFFTTKDYIPFAARLVVPFLLILLIATDDMRRRFNLLLWDHAWLGTECRDEFLCHREPRVCHHLHRHRADGGLCIWG